ncbi:hypothetical protein [Bordetella bronchiseptica]|uniref:hypothetical protein n=1 Tax=Bordetella bronchiseptica TaxID=518 RepID=UPI0004A03E61|nr:hypothetical protein [Bordetella bronchiseptica]KDB70733.1 hypothetical protein AZ21_1770 [Bordetella bronchiseptica B20-10725633]KDB73040.1 hypothetical protein AZ21_2210 [Bordetella bronchiseptica B20-10725633]
MRTDRELLGLAAKAAGMRLGGWEPCPGGFFTYSHRGSDERKTWLPLADDGDALRLAVKLRLEVYIHERDTRALGGNLDTAAEQHGTDAYAATRRAIVRAAAEIGAKMQKANHA